MDGQLWNLFRETGDPMCYLLLKAGEREKEKEHRPAAPKPPQPTPGTPPASL